MMDAAGPDHGSLARRAALASVATALFLLALKTIAAWRTGSVAMLGSLADTSLDLVASLITLFGVHIAAIPADREHRFGHGKAEALAALAQVTIISLSALGIGWQAITRLIERETTANAEFGILVSLIAIASTFLLIFYQRKIIARTGSIAIHTDSVHYQSDLLLNLSVVAGLVLDQYAGFHGADPLFGLGIALWLLLAAWKASKRAIDQLMDKEWPQERRQRLLAIAGEHPDIKGVHDLRTRTSGSHDIIQFHVWVDPAMTVRQAHDVMDSIEADLAREFPDADILIHVDPEGHMDPPLVSPKAGGASA